MKVTNDSKEILFVGISIAVVYLIGAFVLLATLASQGVNGRAMTWVPVAFAVLSFPAHTVEGIVTHGAAPEVRLGGVRMHLFLWEFMINAVIWGLVAAFAWRWIGKRRPASGS
jgi:hypothetical protein